MSLYGGVDYGRLGELLRGVLRKPWHYLPKEQSVSVTLAAGSPKGAEAFAEVTPPEGYVFAIRYFKLTTPPEVQGNILATGMDGVEERLLADNQAENLADQVYDASDWDMDFLFLKKFRLYAVATAVTTADRVVTLRWSGALVLMG